MLALQVLLGSIAHPLTEWQLRLPIPKLPRTGSEIGIRITSLSPLELEQNLKNEILHGQIPTFLRRFVPVTVNGVIDGRVVMATLFVAPDYLAVGSNEDYLYTPLTPSIAQAVADKLHCCLPTPKMVDLIYQAATVKLAPSPIPPSAAMTTVPVFEEHNAMVKRQRNEVIAEFPLGQLVAGNKKDVVVCARLAKQPGHVAIYGWHKLDGNPIQPLYLGHLDSWADYSHGIRLIANDIYVDGRKTTVQKILANPKLCVLLNNEGPVATVRYPH